METAFGASLAGRRSFCGMKHVGLNVAADPLFTIAYTGVNAGMIIGVADDAGCTPLRMSRTPATMPRLPSCHAGASRLRRGPGFYQAGL